MTKKYKKNNTQLLQIRLDDEEYKEIIKFIKSFGVTRREWILAVKSELRQRVVIRDGKFWESDTQYAQANQEKWDKKLTPEGRCEICGKLNEYKNGISQLCRHHYLGYKGDNAFKVQLLCKQCHGKQHTKKYFKKYKEYGINKKTNKE